MAWPEWAVRAWEPVAPYAEKAAVWQGYEAELQTLMIYAVGIALYTALVFAFYQNMAKRDAWRSKRAPGFMGWMIHVFQSWMIFPMMSFLYFSLLASALFLLAKSQAAGGIFLIAMSVVVGVRVVAYASEGAAVDLAKLLPLGLLGVMIVDPSNVEWSQVWARFKDVPSQLPLLGRYFLLFLVLETTLKTVRGIAVRIGERSALKRAAKPLKAVGSAARRIPVQGRPRSAAKAQAREGPAAKGTEKLFDETE